MMLLPASLSAQSLSPTVLASGGGSGNGGGAQMDYTIGELAVSAFSSSQNLLTQGFHQGVSKSSGIAAYVSNGLDMRLYPNPVSQDVYLEFGKQVTQSFQLTLTDISGQVLGTYENIQPQSLQLMHIPMGQYMPGIYFIRVQSQDGDYAQTIKLIKTTN